MAQRQGKYQRLKQWTPSAPKTCVFCGGQYLPTGSRQKTCSKNCKRQLINLTKRIRNGSGEQRKEAPKVVRSPEYVRLRMIETRALKKGLAFSLTTDWWQSQWRAQQGRCALTGFPMQLSGEKRNPWTVSIDRITPELGYVPDNCQMVCYKANEMKADLNDAELRVWLEALLHGLNWREGR